MTVYYCGGKKYDTDKSTMLWEKNWSWTYEGAGKEKLIYFMTDKGNFFYLVYYQWKKYKILNFGKPEFEPTTDPTCIPRSLSDILLGIDNIKDQDIKKKILDMAEEA